MQVFVALACALGCGLMAGFFLPLSICVMKSLAKLPPEQGIAAMQAINVIRGFGFSESVVFGSAAPFETRAAA